MIEADKRPRCPFCGEPAREIAGTAKVTALLNADGTPGVVLRARHFRDDSSYYCGGAHRWRTDGTSSPKNKR